MPDPRQILVLRAGALGDFLLGVPVLQALRRRFSAAQIALVGPLPQARLAAPIADSLTAVDDPVIAPLFVEDGAAGNRAAALPVAVRADLAVVWQRRPAAVVANLRALGTRRIIAGAPFPPPDVEPVPVTDWLAASLRSLGVALPHDWDASPWLEVPPEARTWANGVLTAPGEPEGGAGAESRPLVLHAGSGGSRKNWPEWADVAARLVRQTGRRLVVTCGPADGDALARFLAGYRRLTGDEPAAVVQNATLEQLAAVLQRAAVYLGNDSGVTHLAAAVGAPTVGVFGPTNPRIWRPRGPAVHVLGGTEDAPALLPPGTDTEARWPAPDAVVAAVEAFLSAGTQSRRQSPSVPRASEE
jgi:ADP-heptose:LPS heptosyltransferase